MTSHENEQSASAAQGPGLPGPGRQRQKSSAARKWGPLVAIIAVVAVVAGVTLTSSDDSTTTDENAGPSDGSATTLDPEVVASLPPTYAEATEAGTVDDFEWGDGCDTETGRLTVPSIYAPPCVPEFSGDNGGETGMGVTADTIKIVNYIPAANGDLQALLAGALDTEEVQLETEEKYIAMLSDLYETYGREIEVVNFSATGSDEVAARADAITVAKDIKPFASMGGPALTQAYAEELAANGIMCFGCGISAPDYTYQELAPHMWGSTAAAEQFLLNLGDYVTNRLMGKNAEFAGDDLKDTERVFGVVHFEQDPPVFGRVSEQVKEEGAERGYETELTETYTLDFAKAPERAATIIAKMKDAGVTTIIFLGDPLMPIYLTKAATEQDYFPEWIVTGTVLTDTSLFGRRYDQAQWEHAFGLSNLPVPTPQESRDSWRLHEWYFGEPPAATKTNAIIYPSVAQLFMGIHLAGPNLNPQTFRAGLFRLPPAGGGPTTPQVSYGEHAGFRNPDYTGIDDMAEIWWDADQPGVDEQGVDGVGMYRYSDGGERYLAGEMPKEDPHAFVDEGAVQFFEEIPAEDQWPEYPPPPTSPAGKGG